MSIILQTFTADFGSRRAISNFAAVPSSNPRLRICQRLRSSEIDSKESIPPAYVAWRADTSNRVVVPVRARLHTP